MLDVVALGEILIDFTTQTADPDGYPVMAAHPGGAPSNFLAALAKFGAKTALLGKVGTDRFGELLTATLRQAGIETRGLVADDRVFTTLAFVTLDERGERSFSFARKPGADTCIRFDELELSFIEESKVFHFGSLSLTDEPARGTTQKAVAYAKSLSKLISYDPNLRLPLWPSKEIAREQLLWGLAQADIVKISEEEVDFLFGLSPEDGAQHLFDRFSPKLVFVTCGAKGCYFRTASVRGFIPALQGVRAVDTTGAGDIFGGSALWKLLQTGKEPEDLSGHELSEIVRFGCAAAGLSVRKAGGISSVPDLASVLAAAETISVPAQL